MSNAGFSEPWLRGTLTNVSPVVRAVLHALELVREDTARLCGGLSDAELYVRPFGLAPVAFHLRHIARSIDRLLTYAEGRALSQEQLAALKSEQDSISTGAEVMLELESALADAELRIQAFDVTKLDDVRTVGRRQLPTTVAGLLVHVADHSQRHLGQAITTAKVVVGQRGEHKNP
jgi:uncharacterized damage-inducible protein DinB